MARGSVRRPVLRGAHAGRGDQARRGGRAGRGVRAHRGRRGERDAPRDGRGHAGPRVCARAHPRYGGRDADRDGGGAVDAARALDGHGRSAVGGDPRPRAGVVLALARVADHLGGVDLVRLAVHRVRPVRLLLRRELVRLGAVAALAVRRRLAEVALGQLEALRLALAALFERPGGLVALVVRIVAPDRAGLGSRGALLAAKQRVLGRVQVLVHARAFALLFHAPPLPVPHKSTPNTRRSWPRSEARPSTRMPSFSATRWERWLSSPISEITRSAPSSSPAQSIAP